jgi:hypothetical protein
MSLLVAIVALVSLCLPSLTHPAPPPPVPTTTTTAAPVVAQPAWGCAAALAYLAAHEAPGFTAYCPHYALGHEARTFMTCWEPAHVCGGGTIWIEDPCPAAYMNEAHNSWVLSADPWDPDTAAYDPYGAC